MIDTNINDEYISEITLEYLMNKDQYANYKKNPELVKGVNKKEQRFYRKRIIDLTRKILNGENADQIYPDVKKSFVNYSKMCIDYFKTLDKSDIIQEEYDTLIINNLDESKVEINNAIENDKLMVRSIHIQEPNSLEKIIIRRSTKVVKKPVLPQQKNINLKDPILKNKGICKKKNIDINYEEENNK